MKYTYRPILDENFKPLVIASKQKIYEVLQRTSDLIQGRKPMAEVELFVYECKGCGYLGTEDPTFYETHCADLREDGYMPCCKIDKGCKFCGSYEVVGSRKWFPLRNLYTERENNGEV